jgi:phage shock protein A
MKHNKSDKHRLNILSCLGVIAEKSKNGKMVLWVKEWESRALRALRGLEPGIATHLVEAIARLEQSSDALQNV